jgi:lipopolysaccharide/colanic/teichoic acid biosynthesis glycosyltransferase
MYRTKGKRALDLAIAVLSLPAVVPVVVGAAAVISLDGGSPFFVQPRVGRHGREFGCVKLRTMVIDAETRLNQLLESDPRAASEWAASMKLRKDPRVTRLGRFLRKTSLDELPQIWNVLRGDMSLVGPRPVVPDELSRYGEHSEAYKAVRPGITGAWQASGRNRMSYSERVSLDVEYVQNLKLVTDLGIIARTVIAVAQRTGV